MAVDRLHHPRTLARLGLAALLVATLVSGAGTEVRPVEGAVAPRCAYADTLTRYHGRSDWYRSLLDSRYRLGAGYAPVDLVAASRSGASGYGSIRRFALADFTAMYRASRAAGSPFAIQSAYRSYTTQVATFNRWVREDGYAVALLGSARPGHSEHQLGTTVDLKSPGGPPPWDVADWAQTRAGAWLVRNSWRYGWVMSYPKGRTAATCYQYEPWHFRYYGRIIAARIHRSGLTAREWLFVKGATSTWTGGWPSATPAPTPSPSATPSGSPSESPSDLPSASPSEQPTPSADPTETPASPSPDVTADPGASPTDAPAQAPTEAPTAAPTEAPTPGAVDSPAP